MKFFSSIEKRLQMKRKSYFWVFTFFEKFFKTCGYGFAPTHKKRVEAITPSA
jgi:hypothetical protein